jgi:hypothetical protein
MNKAKKEEMADSIEARIEKLKGDPEYLTQRFLIDITEGICRRMAERGYEDFEELSAALATEASISRRSVDSVLDCQAHQRFTLRALVAMAKAVGLELTWKERKDED